MVSGREECEESEIMGATIRFRQDFSGDAFGTAADASQVSALYQGLRPSKTQVVIQIVLSFSALYHS